MYNRDYVIDYTSYERNDLAVDSPNYMAQKHVYTAWGERLEQFTERGNWDRLLYVHEDVMGNTMHYTKATGQSFGELRCDVWGAPTLSGKLSNNDNGNFVAATFTGHIYDTVLDIYFAEARFYDAKHRQWLSTDPIKDGLNWYQYVGSNPTTFFDPTGLEEIIIVGGVTPTNYQKDNDSESGYERYEKNPYQFFESALGEIQNDWISYYNQIDRGNYYAKPPEPKTIVLYNVGYPDGELKSWEENWNEKNQTIHNAMPYFEDAAEQLGANLVVINTKDELIKYLNSKSLTNEEFSKWRADDLVTKITVYAHGNKTQLWFGYGHANDEQISLSINDIPRIDAQAFVHDFFTKFFSCNTGTGNNSFAQSWVNQLGGSAQAVNDQTDYRYINSLSLHNFDKVLIKALNSLQRKKGKEPGFGFYGAIAAPIPANNGKWITFTPQT